MSSYAAIQRLLPGWLARQILHFEFVLEDAVIEFAAATPQGSLVLDAGAGESRHAKHFGHCHYVPVDLAIGDASWNYGHLAALADLAALPFPDDCFEAALNIVTLEHVREPARVVQELARVLRPGGRLLLIAPQEWEVHQSPHDYFRYTRHGLRHLLDQAGFEVERLDPAGGFFRLLSRRLMNALQFFPGPLLFVAAVAFVPLALLVLLFEPLDRKRDFTLGYICVAIRA
jgi:SAM-dependent methyltransferase